jgi:glutathione S-transferase
MGIMVIVLVLVLMQYSFFGIKVGMARVKYDIQAPAISGHPVFERYYRVHQNTLEQLLVFVPLYLVFAVMAEGQGWMGSELATACGVLWIIGRFIYSSAYIEDPAKRGMGFMLSFLATVLLMMGNLAAAIMSLLG